MRVLKTSVLLFITTLMVLSLTVDGICEFRYGDVNNDGWCNGGDLVALTCYFNSSAMLQCPGAADINGDGYVTGSDVAALVNFFRFGIPAPVNACSLTSIACEDFNVKPIIYIRPTLMTVFNVCTLSVFMAAPNSPATEVSTLNFSFLYDPAVFATGTFSASSGGVWDRPFPPSYGPQTDNVVSFIWSAPPGVCSSMPIGADTHIFDIYITMVSPQPTGNTYFLCVLDEDPVMGPPRFFLDLAGGAQKGDDCLQPYCPVYIVGDVNGDRITIGSDVTRLVSYFRGIIELQGTHFNCTPVKW